MKKIRREDVNKACDTYSRNTAKRFNKTKKQTSKINARAKQVNYYQAVASCLYPRFSTHLIQHFMGGGGGVLGVTVVTYCIASRGVNFRSLSVYFHHHPYTA